MTSGTYAKNAGCIIDVCSYSQRQQWHAGVSITAQTSAVIFIKQQPNLSCPMPGHT